MSAELGAALIAGAVALSSRGRKGDELGRAHPLLRVWLTRARAELPFEIAVVSSTRTYAEQDRIYQWGRTTVNPYTGPILPGKPLGRIATNARGGQSPHQVRADGYSHAIDLRPGAATFEEYQQLGEHAQSYGLTWGGTFKVDGAADLPHVETASWRTIPEATGADRA